MLQYLEAILFDIKYTVVSLSADVAGKMVTVFAEQFRNNVPHQLIKWFFSYLQQRS